MFGQEKLEEISPDHWTSLRDLYLANWPTNLLGYYTIDNYIKWIEKLPTIKDSVFIYSLNGDWSDGSYALVDSDVLFTSTLAESNERLTTLLSLLKWSTIRIVSDIRKKHRSAFSKVLNLKKFKLRSESETLLYYKSKEECRELKVSIPKGISVENLTPVQVEYANSVWPHGNDGSTLSFLRRLSDLNPNIALTTDNGQLVSWCFRLPSGLMGALQVDEQFQQKGFGSLTVKLMAIKLSQLGHDAVGCVVQDNLSAQELFKRNGFKLIDNLSFAEIQHL